MYRRTPVEVVQIERLCELCGGTMRPDGRTLTSDPPQYPHACEKCGHIQTFKQVYPAFQFSPKDNSEIVDDE